jgi:hypothetical protein
MLNHLSKKKILQCIAFFYCLGPWPTAETTATASCDELKFEVSSCMLFNGSNTMAACQSCVYTTVNQLATASSAPASDGQASSGGSSTTPATVTTKATCEQLNELMCNTLHADCHGTCQLGACYNSTTAWATCLIASYAPPNCTVSCPDAAGGGSPTTSPTSGGLLSATGAAASFTIVMASVIGIIASAGGW